MSLLSVVIPMYNCEKYIGQCLDSIINQNKVDLEIIVVDDGSNDCSIDIVESYEQVKLCQVSHNGASAARNYGLNHSHGEYVMYMDADDFLDNSDICYRCISAMERENTNMTLFSYKYFFENSKEYGVARTLQLSDMSGCPTVQILSKMIKGGYFPASPCFRIFRRNHLLDNNLRFEEKTTSEDIDWFVRTLISMERFSVIDDTCYCYRKGLQTSVTGGSSLSKCFNFINALKRSVRCVNRTQDRDLTHLLYSGLAYEYSILLSNVYDYLDTNYIADGARSLSWLLNCQSFPSVNKVSILYRVFGLRLTSLLLQQYSRFRSHSHN